MSDDSDSIRQPHAVTAASETPESHAETKRREFLKRTACWALGGGAVLIPAGAGTVVWLAPLQSAPPGAVSVRLTSLDSLPVGGTPQLFQVVAQRTDAWTREAASGLGAVFLQRTNEREVRAFNASCPHLGCAVEFRAAIAKFFCPCHNSTFAADGKIDDPSSPSLRPLDALDVHINDAGEVWVKFENFRAGIAAKLPAA
ncbi:MAG: ubiquinol-cytochrome c reductase iron-sulfur subunit [Verrucomicrobiales bacterium]